MTRTLIAAALAATLAAPLVACSGGDATTPANTSSEAVSESRILALQTYADWCSSCKILDPKVADLREAGIPDGVELTVLDYTDRDIAAFYDQAEAAGGGEALREHFAADGVTTGILLLVNADSQEVVSIIKKEMSIPEMQTAMQTALDNAV